MPDKTYPAIFSMAPIGKDGEYECESRLMFCCADCRTHYLHDAKEQNTHDPEYRPDIIVTQADRPFFNKDETRNVILLARDSNLDEEGICNNCGGRLEDRTKGLDPRLVALLDDDNVSAAEIADWFRTILEERLDYGVIMWDKQEECDLRARDVAQWIEPCIGRLQELRDKAIAQEPNG